MTLSPTPFEPDPDLLAPGVYLDERYEIGARIGDGGFAQVFEGVQLNIDRPVAIKILDLHRLTDVRGQAMVRFRREARLAARLRHPGVVTIYDFGTTPQGDFYIVMDRLQGESLDDALERGGPMALERACALVVEVLEAIEAAHRLGVVHRDLKPANLFVERVSPRRDMLKILDFGLAWVRDQTLRLTVEGQILGTPQYMPPESFEGLAVTPAIDVYQMALVLMEMMTGARVVDVKGIFACLDAHLEVRDHLPRAIVEGPLAGPLLDALDPDPAQRTPDARTFRLALRRAMGWG